MASTKSKRASGRGQKRARGAKRAPGGSTGRKPKPPFPEQHQRRPGLESKLEPRPRYEAPQYRGSGKLDGLVALITGGDSGIGRAVAVLYAREGADVGIVYLEEEERRRGDARCRGSGGEALRLDPRGRARSEVLRARRATSRRRAGKVGLSRQTRSLQAS